MYPYNNAIHVQDTYMHVYMQLHCILASGAGIMKFDFVAKVEINTSQ